MQLIFVIYLSRCPLWVPSDPPVPFNISPSLSLSKTLSYLFFFFFVFPGLPLCLSQLPSSLILNPVEIGQAEWASFDQALISRVLTVSAHPDPTEPWSPSGELQTGVHPLTLFESMEKQTTGSTVSRRLLHKPAYIKLSKHLHYDLKTFSCDNICVFSHELSLQ